MYLRLALLGLAFAIAGGPVCAGEVAVLLTGDAFPGDNSTQIPTPFAVSFDLDTLSGQQSYVFGVGPCLQTLDVSSIVVSNFTASVGGQRIASAPTQLGQVVGDGIGCALEAAMVFPSSQFVWAFFATPAPTKTEFATWSDPLASMLTSFNYQGNQAGIFNPDGSPEWNLAITNVAVPEPGALELMALGMLGVAGASFVRRWPPPSAARRSALKRRMR